MNFDAAAVERKIGYSFRDKRLLETCFTHSSYANAHGGESNERLEFLGDALLGAIVAESLYRAGGRTEGEMTSLRIRLVSAKPLESAVRAAGLDSFLRVYGSRTAGEKAVSSLFEALVAAIYLDGGVDAARAFVNHTLPSYADAEPNYKGDLQEYLQSLGLPRAVYAVLSQSGEAHAPRFTVRAEGGGRSAVGEGGSVREAEKRAARILLEQLKQNRGE